MTPEIRALELKLEEDYQEYVVGAARDWEELEERRKVSQDKTKQKQLRETVAFLDAHFSGHVDPKTQHEVLRVKCGSLPMLKDAVGVLELATSWRSGDDFIAIGKTLKMIQEHEKKEEKIKGQRRES